MKVHELLENNTRRVLNNSKKIERWLKYAPGIKNYTIRDNGIVDVDGDVILTQISLTYTTIASLFSLKSPIRDYFIPVQFGTVAGDFSVSDTALVSLVGSPKVCGISFFCTNTKIQSFEGAPEIIKGSLVANGCLNVHSLHNIHKHVKEIGGHFLIPETVATSILGLLKIRNLTSAPLFSEMSEELMKAGAIVNRHLKGDRNIHACQEELLEAGLKEFARL